MTLARWGEIYLTTYVKEKESVADDAWRLQHLCRVLGGNLFLSQLTRAHEEEYHRLLTASSLHLRRIIVCAYETGM